MASEAIHFGASSSASLGPSAITSADGAGYFSRTWPSKNARWLPTATAAAAVKARLATSRVSTPRGVGMQLPGEE